MPLLGNSLLGFPSGIFLSTSKFPPVGILIGTVTGSLVIVATLLILWKKKGGFQILCFGNTMEMNTKTCSGDELVFFGKEEGEREFGLEKLFGSKAEVMGKGVFGTTYKTHLEVGNVVVVKRLGGGTAGDFRREKIEELGRMVHENLMPIKAYYIAKDATLFVYDYMRRGSLSDCLHGKEGTNKISLKWEVRRKIAYGVARGIEYLHSRGPDMCHGNIRSSNVLLSDSFDARVSEFGMPQPLSTDSNPVSSYRAPEVTNHHKVSHKADVYSFGVLLLELITGKPPMCALSWKNGEDLPKWVRSLIREKPIVDLFDQKFLMHKEEMTQILQLAICCTFEYPKNRPSMNVVADQIRDICYSGS